MASAEADPAGARVLRWAAVAALSLLWLTCAFRAATMSITCDEAITWLRYTRHSWLQPLTSFDANHHILHTLLVKASVDLLGTTEWTVRLPTLIGAAVYFACSLALAWRAFAGAGPRLLLLALLTLNPLLLDFLSLARGYGLGVAMLMWAWIEMQRAEEAATRGRLVRASLALGLAVSCNLVMLYPATASAAVFVLTQRRLGRRLLPFVLVGPAIATAICFGPLQHVTRGMFYAGIEGYGESARALVAASLLHGSAGWDPVARWMLVHYAAMVCAAVLVLIAASLFARRGNVLFRGAAMGTLALLALSHEALGALLPLPRTGLYLVPLFTLAAAEAARDLLPQRSWARPIGWATAAVGAAAVALYARQFHLAYTGDWPHDQPVRRLLDVAARQAGDDAALGYRYAMYQPVLAYYWATDPRLRDVQLLPARETRGATLFLGRGELDRALAAEWRGEVLAEDPEANVILARLPRAATEAR